MKQYGNRPPARVRDSAHGCQFYIYTPRSYTPQRAPKPIQVANPFIYSGGCVCGLKAIPLPIRTLHVRLIRAALGTNQNTAYTIDILNRSGKRGKRIILPDYFSALVLPASIIWCFL